MRNGPLRFSVFPGNTFYCLWPRDVPANGDNTTGDIPTNAKERETSGDKGECTHPEFLYQISGLFSFVNFSSLFFFRYGPSPKLSLPQKRLRFDDKMEKTCIQPEYWAFRKHGCS